MTPIAKALRRKAIETGLCQGPFDRHTSSCPHKARTSGVFGGRCKDCKRARNLDRYRKIYSKRAYPDHRPKRIGRKTPYVNPEIQAARQVMSKTFGIRGALKVIEVMQRAAL